MSHLGRPFPCPVWWGYVPKQWPQLCLLGHYDQWCCSFPLLHYTEEVRNPPWAPGQEPSKFLLMVLSFSPVRRAGPGETRTGKEELGNKF
jgi:hypothetical protein